MRRRPPNCVLALAPAVLGAFALAVALLGVAVTIAEAQPVSFAPCPSASGFSCASVQVPLSRTGLASGTITLSLQRLSAAPTQSRSAVIALAGGPGQAVLPLSTFIAKAIAPALSTRDLLLFDQRGTGSSDPLSCAVFTDPEALEAASSLGQVAATCANQIGPARGSFTTQESVEDIESLRVDLGYEKLVLYGTSYGTKVALEYAERYPQNVEDLVLDSVVPSEGPEPFELSSFRALRPILSELCSAGACSRITSSPLGDVARLSAQLHRHPLSGSVYDGSGHRHSASMGEPDLLNILEAGDLNPALRALLPAAVRSALRGDPDPLLRLDLLAQGFIPNLPSTPKSGGEADEAENNTLFLDTTCEEKPFPWQRAAAPATRKNEALAAIHAVPSSAFYPFDADTALEFSLIPECLEWPDASPAPPATRPLPDVPTLILSGGQDFRTPTSGAQAVAARIPGASLVVVPFTGHSVLGADFSGCAAAAVSAFFGGAPVQPCPSAKDPFSPTPVTPTRLSYLQAVPGLAGKAGRTLTAVLDTIVDLDRQVAGATLEADATLPSGSSFGGLHGGYARLSSTEVRLHDLTFVSGVQVSGIFKIGHSGLEPGTVSVSGSGAAHGSVNLGSGALVNGTLGGRHFKVSVSKARLSSSSPAPGAWPSQLTHFPSPPLARLR